MFKQSAQWYLVVGGETSGWKLRDCRATQLEQAEQEAEEALKDIRAKGDQTSIVRVVEATSGDVVYATTRREQYPVEGTCEQGGRHRWDEADASCLDCGRRAAECADELHEWLVEKEDLIDHMGDQIEVLRTLLEEAAEALDTAGVLETRDKILAALTELEE